jgi:hypothetical protein
VDAQTLTPTDALSRKRPRPAHRATPWTLAGGLGVVLALAGAKLALHLVSAVAFGYGYFVDELYYLATAQHLAWGYVDLPPLVPVLTALVRSALGDSLLAVRLVPSLAGAALVVLTAWLARKLGGGRWAQALAAVAVLVAPVRLAIDSFHSMNALEPLFWTGCAAVLVHLLQGGDRRWWLAFGALAGVGLLNKHSMAFFGVAVVVGLLLTAEGRRALRERWIWLGGLVALAIFLPNLVWSARHGRNVSLGPLAFLAQQVLANHPLALPLWLGGLGWFLFGREGRRYRALGIAFLGVIAEMLLSDGRIYYPAPAYPMLFAAGGVAFERGLARLRSERARRLLPAAYAVLLLATGAVLAPLFVPLLPPQTHVRYARFLGFDQPRIENHRLGPLPQLHADRFGWPEMAREVARIYHALPPEDRARAAVFGQNYGQAGAIDLFGPALGLPPVLSGHLSYHDWGLHGFDGSVLIVMDDDRETLERYFGDVEYGGRVEHPYSMPYQHFDVWVCRDPKVDFATVWPRLKKLD